MNIISRDEALELGLVSYYTGIPCKYGHIEKRYSRTGICYQCKRDENKRDRERYPKRAKELSRQQYKVHRDKKLAYSQLWAEENREKSNFIKRKNKQKYKEEYLQQEKDRQKELRKNNPSWRLSRIVSKRVWHYLKVNNSSKNNLSWTQLVNLNIDELKIHLERQFTKDMTWDNHGTYWHIDHLIPQSWFINNSEFQIQEGLNLCWAIPNLRPLKKLDNLSKGDKLPDNLEQILQECKKYVNERLSK